MDLAIVYLVFDVVLLMMSNRAFQNLTFSCMFYKVIKGFNSLVDCNYLRAADVLRLTACANSG